ncbi:hypothetical protein FI667_g11324, partial [Globisporangium splendens]
MVTTRFAATSVLLLCVQQIAARMAVDARRVQCSGVQELHDMLVGANKDDTAELLATCTHPLLFVSVKWATPAQAVAYCKQDECKEVVKRLEKLPACTWQHIPTDSESELLVAQRMLQDCGTKKA